MPTPATAHPSEPEPQDGDRASVALRLALSQRRDALAQASGLPVDDKALTERILGEARRRSETISLRQQQAGSSARQNIHGPGIPWWLNVAWILALIAVAAAWYLL